MHDYATADARQMSASQPRRPEGRVGLILKWEEGIMVASDCRPGNPRDGTVRADRRHVIISGQAGPARGRSCRRKKWSAWRWHRCCWGHARSTIDCGCATRAWGTCSLPRNSAATTSGSRRPRRCRPRCSTTWRARACHGTTRLRLIDATPLRAGTRGRRSSGGSWPGGLATGSARGTRAGSRAEAVPATRRTGCRRWCWPARRWGTARWPRSCWRTARLARCGRV